MTVYARGDAGSGASGGPMARFDDDSGDARATLLGPRVDGQRDLWRFVPSG